jgi:hypothetical protein
MDLEKYACNIRSLATIVGLCARGAVELIESFGETYGKKKNSMLMALRFLLAS